MKNLQEIRDYFYKGAYPTFQEMHDFIDTVGKVLYTARVYEAGEAVIIDNSGYKLYLCIEETTSGESPITTPSKWELVAAGGGGGAVDSVFGRTGTVVAESDDYEASEVTNAADLTADSNAFAGQAHSGNSLESFSATKTFNANNGTEFEMDVTATTTINIENDLPGQYTFRLKIDTATTPTINVGVSMGTKLSNSLDFDNTDGVVNILTMVHWPSGAKDYNIIN